MYASWTLQGSIRTRHTTRAKSTSSASATLTFMFTNLQSAKHLHLQLVFPLARHFPSSGLALFPLSVKVSPILRLELL